MSKTTGRKTTGVTSIATLAILGILLTLVGCQNTNTPSSVRTSTPATTAVAQTVGLIKGVAFSARSQQPADFTSFFDSAKQAGSAIMWAGDWMQLSQQNGAPAVVAQLALKYGYTPIIEVQFFSQSTGKLFRPLDQYAQTYEDSLSQFVSKYKPPYLGIGVEVNVLYEKAPDDFDSFVQLYKQCYDLVKAESPDTKIFTVFQLEKMEGLNGGLFGGANDPGPAQWSLLGDFPSDLVAFTTYPDLVFHSPDDIPADYYSQVSQHTVKPIAFTEIGWHSAASPKGWESSEAMQATFVKTFFKLSQPLDKKIAIWSFLYDQQTIEPFDSMGLLGKDGPKASWEVWCTEK